MIRTTPANRPRHGYNTFVSFTHREKAAAVLVSSSRYTNNPEGALSQDLTELFAQFIDSIRFCGNPSETVFLILGHNRIVRVATGHDRLDIRIDLPELQYRLFPPHAAGYGQIHNDRIKGAIRLEGMGIQLNGLYAILGKFDCAPKVFQHLSKH